MSAPTDVQPARPRTGVHRAWFVAAAVVSALIAAAGFRSSTGALIEPLEASYGWSRTTTSATSARMSGSPPVRRILVMP